jgi:urea transport system permease protein
MTGYWYRLAWVAVLIYIGAAVVAPAAAATLTPPERLAVMQNFCAGGGAQRTAITHLVEAGVADDRDWSGQVIAALRGGSFVCSETAGHLFVSNGSALDASTLKHLAEAPADAPYVPSIVMMRLLAVAAAELDLFSSEVEKRRAAATQIDKAFATLNPALVARAIGSEHDADIKLKLTVALAKRGLNSELPADRLRAIDAVAQVPSEASRTLLRNFLADRKDMLDPESARATKDALRTIDLWLTVGQVCSVLFSGLSYAGILLITALGLSIVFGLLGVINLAHGEFIMIGAYATFVVEQLMQAYLPGMFDAYIFVAIPVAFFVCALCGVLLEVCVIRFLYRRPLETLLATWAVSIALIKLVQITFGSQNVEFITPAFLNGGMQVFAGFFITWNRIFAIVLALAIFATAFGLIRHTRFGLLVRATTQRRDTARCLGVPAERIDRLAFGLGAGLAGLAGVVLTQITSVNPSMGTSFVVDAFMVVVLGGAGSLVGTAVSSLALGEINQVIEPMYGAVAAKVAVLVLIVLIIQRRPQGLFALKTRV